MISKAGFISRAMLWGTVKLQRHYTVNQGHSRIKK